MAAHLTNPSNHPHEQMKKKIIRHMKAELFNEKMIKLMKDTYTESLQRENIVATRNEKRRLFQAVLREMFDDILAKI